MAVCFEKSGFYFAGSCCSQLSVVIHVVTVSKFNDIFESKCFKALCQIGSMNQLADCENIYPNVYMNFYVCTSLLQTIDDYAKDGGPGAV